MDNPPLFIQNNEFRVIGYPPYMGGSFNESPDIKNGANPVESVDKVFRSIHGRLWIKTELQKIQNQHIWGSGRALTGI